MDRRFVQTLSVWRFFVHASMDSFLSLFSQMFFTARLHVFESLFARSKKGFEPLTLVAFRCHCNLWWEEEDKDPDMHHTTIRWCEFF